MAHVRLIRLVATLALALPILVSAAPDDIARLEALIERQARLIEAQEARLTELERLNRELRERVDASAATAGERTETAVTNALDTLRGEFEAVATNSTLAAGLAFVKSTGVSVVPYGYFKFDAVHDSARTAFGDASVFVMPRSSSGGGRRDLTFSAREARLGFNIAMPENSRLKVTGMLEGDFYGDLAHQDSYQLRLRLAYLDGAWGEGWSLRLGQDWDTFVAFHPRMLDAGILAGTGHVWGRRPQVRLTKVTPLGERTRLVAKGAVENGYKNDVDVDGQQDSNAAGIPQFTGQLALHTRVLTKRDIIFSLGGLYGQERTRRDPNPDTYAVELAQLALQLPLADPFTLQGTLWAGKNLDAYYGGIMQGIDLALGRAVSSRGGWVQGLYDLGERLSCGLGYGFDDPSDGDLSLATSRTLNERYFASLFYKATPHLIFGCEYSLLRTEFKDEGSMTDNRIQLSGQLNF